MPRKNLSDAFVRVWNEEEQAPDPDNLDEYRSIEDDDEMDWE